MRVAAYQAPIHATDSADVVGLIREQVVWCEANGLEILYCPEAILGGLADYATQAPDVAVEGGRLRELLTPLASNSVTTIIGFTELGPSGLLYNSAAVFHKGTVIGTYRKLYPAINKSVYASGREAPVFTAGGLTFGILICNDSNYHEPARIMASKGAAALFVPTNNGLPPSKAGAELVTLARGVDIARAVDNSVYVIRADVAGSAGGLVSRGTSEIVNPDGTVLRAARQLLPELIVADINPAPRERRRGWDAPRNGAVMEEYLRLLTGARV